MHGVICQAATAVQAQRLQLPTALSQLLYRCIINLRPRAPETDLLALHTPQQQVHRKRKQGKAPCALLSGLTQCILTGCTCIASGLHEQASCPGSHVLAMSTSCRN